MKKKALIASILTIALCLCLIAGSTFALFTSSQDLNVAVTAGKVQLTAKYATDSMKTWSYLYQTEEDARTDGLFDNNGTAKFVQDANNGYTMVEIDRMTPGDVAKFKIDVTNLSNVNVQYRVRMISVNGSDDPNSVDLTEALSITAYIDGAVYPVTGKENASVWRFIDANQPIEDIWVTIVFKNGSTMADLEDLSSRNENWNENNPDNKYQEAKARMVFVVEAVQGNAPTQDFMVASVEDFFVPATDDYIATGIHNGEGKTIPLTTEAIGIKGDVTLANMTLDGSTATDTATLFAINEEDFEETTLILSDNTKIVATAVADRLNKAINAVNVPGQVFTLIVDESAKITADGENAGALVLQGGEHNIVLNGRGLIEVTNDAYGIIVYNYQTVPTVVNIYVEDNDAMNEYLGLLDYVADGAQINWFVDGTPVDNPYAP